MIYKNDISTLKKEIVEKVGQKIIVRGSLGRNKFFEEQAVIKETYPNIFVVKYEEQDTNVSYRYSDILTRELEVSVFDGEGYCPLIPPLQK
ncbi:MAG: Veg family protein [Clostridia bacterium]|nr:Veg family protein [Clostridia bacterium]